MDSCQKDKNLNRFLNKTNEKYKQKIEFRELDSGNFLYFCKKNENVSDVFNEKL